MIYTETEIPGVFIVEPEQLTDERGFFARSFCRREFEKQGLNPDLVQCNISFNHKRGTLRGMHYQAAPYEEAKLIRCTMGAIYDVALDLRKDSPTFKNWVSVELTEKSLNMIYIPEGVAHGFQTLEDDTEVFYQMSQFFNPECARGVRWDDPAFSIVWPEEMVIVSMKDSQYKNFYRGSKQ